MLNYTPQSSRFLHTAEGWPEAAVVKRPDSDPGSPTLQVKQVDLTLLLEDAELIGHAASQMMNGVPLRK